jgi:hypothetical protein
MLDPWIIEEIKRREQSGRIERPVLEIPIQGPDGRDIGPGGRGKPEAEDDPPRGVAIIDYGVACW